MGNILNADNEPINLVELLAHVPQYPASVMPNEEPYMSMLSTLCRKTHERKRDEGQEHCRIVSMFRTQDCSILVKENKYVVSYRIERCGDLVSNFHLINGPLPYSGLRRVRLRTMTGKQVLEDTKITPGVCHPGILCATNIIFPITALLTDSLVLELEFTCPADVQAFLTRQITLEYQVEYCSHRVRKYIMSNPVSVPDYDVILYRGKLFQEYKNRVSTPTHEEMRRELGISPEPVSPKPSWEDHVQEFDDKMQKTGEAVYSQMRPLLDKMYTYMSSSQYEHDHEEDFKEEPTMANLTESQTLILEDKKSEEVVLFEAPALVITSQRLNAHNNSPKTPKLETKIDSDADLDTDTEPEWDRLTPEPHMFVKTTKLP